MDIYGNAKTITLKRKDGSAVSLKVRRVRTSAEVQIQTAADVRTGSIASQNRFAMLKARYALVGASGLFYEDTGETIEFAKEQHPGLGSIATAEVFDALTDLETLCVLLLADGLEAENVEKVAAASLDKERNALEVAAGTREAREEETRKN